MPARNEGRLEVTLVRLGKRPLDDDNLIAAFKHWRDGVAQAFKVSDNHRNIEFWYEQRPSPQYEIHVELRMRRPDEAP
jgi:hypothetical protein